MRKPFIFLLTTGCEQRLKNKPVALFQLILSMIIYGTIGICRRSLPVGSAFLAMFRGILGGLLLLVLHRIRGRKLDLSSIGAHALPLFTSGALIGFNWIFLFESYRYTSVAISTLCYYMAPSFVILLTPIVFKEKLGPHNLLCLGLSVLGMLGVTGIFSDHTADANRLLGIAFGLSAAVLYASVILINKKSLGQVPVWDRTITQLGTAGAVILPYVLLVGDVPAPLSDLLPHLPLLLLIAFLHTGVAYLLYFSSVEKLPSQTIALLSYLDPVTAVLLSAFFLREPMDIYAIIGTVLILLSAVLGEMFPIHQKEAQ